MKALFLTLLLPSVLAGAELKDVKSVYLYPMVGGLDQHLANRLTKVATLAALTAVSSIGNDVVAGQIE